MTTFFSLMKKKQTVGWNKKDTEPGVVRVPTIVIEWKPSLENSNLQEKKRGYLDSNSRD